MNLAYRIDGHAEGPTLVLANSLGTTTDLWDAQVAALAGRFRIVRYDHPGHGASPDPEEPVTVEAMALAVVELLDRLELERASFCGLSLGGMVGMDLALAAPERLDRLVLCCTAAYLGPPDGWRERARIVRAQGPAAIADAVLARWLTPHFRDERREATAVFRTMLESTQPEGYAACCEAIAQFDLRARLGEIHAPTLVISGADDVATPPDDGALLARAIAGAEHVVLPAAAHLANVEQPDGCTDAIRAHLDLSNSEEAA